MIIITQTQELREANLMLDLEVWRQLEKMKPVGRANNLETFNGYDFEFGDYDHNHVDDM